MGAAAILKSKPPARLWPHGLALLSVILAFAGSFALLSTVIGITSPWLALLLMFYFLGTAKTAEPIVKLRLPRSLRRLRGWELDGRLYRRLSVLEFGRLLRHSPLRYLNTAVYLKRNRTNLSSVLVLAESAEASHFWAGVCLLPYMVLVGLNGMWVVVVWFSLAQLVVNVYPILHLRYIRGRLQRVADIFKERDTRLQVTAPDYSRDCVCVGAKSLLAGPLITFPSLSKREP